MQYKQSIEKFSKKHRVCLEGTDIEATITRGKKLNKPQRGGGIKGAFRSDDESYINAAKYAGEVK